jgi:hypothetical protein
MVTRPLQASNPVTDAFQLTKAGIAGIIANKRHMDYRLAPPTV